MLVGLSMFLLTGVSFAEEVKYEVNISIKYNAVDKCEAANLVKQILSRHGDACETEVNITKIDDGLIDIGYLNATDTEFDTDTFTLQTR